MAITTQDGLLTAMAAGRTVQFQKSQTTITAGGFFTLWRVAGAPTGNTTLPGTGGAVLTRTSIGSLPIPAPSAVTYAASYEAVSTVQGALMTADRLVEFGGLSGTVTTAQTVSAVALPARATGATDVELWLEILAATGATASAVTASYTNQAGTANRTATLVGGLPANAASNRMFPFALQAGDTGVRTVESVTIATSTGTAGNVGLVLRRTLLLGIIPTANVGFVQGYAETDLQIVPDDAALELYVLSSTTSSGALLGAVGIAQG